MTVVADQVIDIREIVSRRGGDYWYTRGWPPLKVGVCLHRRDCAPDVTVGDTQTFRHYGSLIRMKCVDVDVATDTTTWEE